MDAMIRRVKKETQDIFRGCQVSLPGISNIVLDIWRKTGGEPNKEEGKHVHANVKNCGNIPW